MMCKKCHYVTWSRDGPRQCILGKRYLSHRVSGIILLHKGKVLLVRSYRHWGFPKGALRAEEDPWLGACRELLEETGIEMNLPASEFQVWSPTTNSTFYIKEISEMTRSLLPRPAVAASIPDNDSSGVGWFRIGCVEKEVTSDTMTSNCYLRMFLDRAKRLARHKRKGEQ